MRELGFEVTFHPHQEENTPNGENPSQTGTDEDESVTRFFSLAGFVPGFSLSVWTDRFQEQFLRYAEYFGAAFENSIGQLLFFVTAVLLIVLAKHLYANLTFRKARNNICLSIGGWGTRGKSGTERLKAAIIGAMGHGLVSKTTGCEAMFIHGEPYGDPLEIPLFRPYDKATIWEQRDLILTASKLNPSVFLWECMALTPAYVDVLSRQWMKDDLATITNTYPDHEDLQGPAGHNVAQTISGFVPERSHLISTEEVMRPYLLDSCREAETTFRSVGWLESGLVTEDVMERFPYKEHPDNIALVAAMASELGLDYEVSVKAMGDYLVPDLGVLKTHPIAEVRARKIEFTNGMSANERFGCMGNWKRLGFDQQDPWEDPTTWVYGVVNNRADRVPRSKVFAKIIVEDMHADRFFLIGNNLKGLLSFIHEAWNDKALTLSLADRGKPWDKSFAKTTFRQAAKDFRQTVTAKQIQTKLRCMLDALSDHADDAVAIDVNACLSNWDNPQELEKILLRSGISENDARSIKQHQQQWGASLAEYNAMMERIETATPKDAQEIGQEYVALLERWYFRKLVVVENYDASGEEVLGRIVDETPHGFLARTIGLQNIKGTGLDFVYRFQAWDACFEACNCAVSDNASLAMKGLQALVGMPDIGQLAECRVREVVEMVRQGRHAEKPELAALLTQLERKLDEIDASDPAETHTGSEGQRDEKTQDPSGTPHGRNISSRTEWNAWLLETSEHFLDVSDSLRRRDMADAIYRDLADGRISRQRAVLELRQINKRQKGGWLSSWWNRFRSA